MSDKSSINENDTSLDTFDEAMDIENVAVMKSSG